LDLSQDLGKLSIENFLRRGDSGDAVGEHSEGVDVKRGEDGAGAMHDGGLERMSSREEIVRSQGREEEGRERSTEQNKFELQDEDN
jgi:hypothetical protein